MSRSIRKSYPEKVRYMTRFDAGSIQKVTGLPASLVYRLRRGEVKSLSRRSTEKFEAAYNHYWDNRLKRGGVNKEERAFIIRNEKPLSLSSIVRQNIDVAREIAINRRERDSALPDFKKSWHTITDILRQMSKDIFRTADDWLWIAQNGSPKSKKR